MALFQEINCTHCGKKTNMLTRTKLSDGKHICSKCKSTLPGEFSASLHHYNYEEFKMLLAYVEDMRKNLRNIFRETHNFYGIHIDTEHGLFYIGSCKSAIFKFENLEDFDLEYEPEELKEGFFSTTVTGKLLIRVKVTFPYYFRENVLEDCVSASADVKVGLLKNKAVYNNPKGMDEFLHYFYKAWETAINEKTTRLEAEAWQYNEQYQESAIPSQLQQAMALFMIDDLNGLTLDDIKQRRNRLIKTFHPDHGGAGDTQYAQKINSAFEVLKASVS